MTATEKINVGLQILKSLKFSKKEKETFAKLLTENTSQSANVRSSVGARADSRKALKALYKIKVK